MLADQHSNQEDVRTDPLMAALGFTKRWKALLKNVLKGKNKPLGKITDYFARVEFQVRGSQHLHIFLWADANLKFESGNEKNIFFINKTISTTIPPENVDCQLHQLVKKFQVHKHTFTCKKGSSSHCRFLLPRPTCAKTRLTYNTDTIATRHGCFYEMKQNPGDEMVNAYNPTILKHWHANHDIQILGNADSCAYYVCKYVYKAEPQELKNALESLFQKFKTTSMTHRQKINSNRNIGPKTQKIKYPGMCIQTRLLENVLLIA